MGFRRKIAGMGGMEDGSDVRGWLVCAGKQLAVRRGFSVRRFARDTLRYFLRSTTELRFLTPAGPGKYFCLGVRLVPAFALTFRRTDGGRCPVNVAMQRGSTSDVWPKDRACDKSKFSHLFFLCRYINTPFHISFLIPAVRTPFLSPVPTHRFCTHSHGASLWLWSVHHELFGPSSSWWNLEG